MALHFPVKYFRRKIAVFKTSLKQMMI